ncbi:uncharacterized protein EAE97_005218 [Botrytis byssoidea]|uniref:Amidase domain-containing protein n=1 Tax=Botrytis byssoidea TaxID=139641 RepID=A0A9P5IK20_9HELO|nr:uncharacterized protein EAE97_005218 [Botrytis byssoidea]KAF7944585.1 hypothetical protein EAE97_005218 [Botrytis byssoidea]
MASKASAGVTKWQDVASEVQKHQDATIAKVEPAIVEITEKLPRRVISLPRKYLSPEEITITETPIEKSLASLATGKLSSLAVTKAFLRRAAIAQKLVLARAKELDEHFAKKGPIGPLHGLPISVKEHIGMKDLDNTCGLVGWVGRKNHDDANILKILLAAGAVLYVRTNEPQGLMMLETVNNIGGRTTNPHNTALTPGGSSGGESALQALVGSLLGIGSDIGGSIRSPSVQCGLYGLRPTTFRLPLVGLAAPSMGCDTIAGAIGPLSRSLEGIDLFMKVALHSKPCVSDPSLHQKPWITGQTSTDRLTIGVMWDDGIVKPSPPVTIALNEVVEKLKQVPGVEIIEWKPYQHDNAMKILTKLYACDGGEFFTDALALSEEPGLPLTNYTLKDSSGVQNLTHQQPRSVKIRFLLLTTIAEWNTMAPKMDLILCPAGPLPAPPHDASKYWGYTSIWNLLDYPAIVFPVTKVNPVIDVKDGNYKTRNDLDKWYHDHYNVEEQIGAPVGLQLVAKKLEDEKVVDVMRFIKEKIGVPFVDCFQD